MDTTMPRPSPGRLSAADHWELWSLQALDPAADAATLADLRRRRRRWERHERAVLREGRVDVTGLLRSAEQFLERHPGLRSGLVLSLHLGPYSLVPALLRWSGVVPAVVVDGDALPRVRPGAEAVCAALGLSPGVEWIVTSDRGFAHRLVRVLRAGRPVVMYLDGNRGEGGLARTREAGLPYHLPGRTIRVRTGPGRLAARLGCPLHGVSVHWREDGSLAWHAQCLPVARGEDPAAVTRRCWDWLFTRVRCDPAQWSHLGMLAASAACFARAADDPDPAAVRRRRRWFRHVLDRAPEQWLVRPRGRLEVWAGRVLVDRDHDAFYPAGGLDTTDLALLDGASPATLAALVALRGEEWVVGPLCRLYVLGLVELQAVP